MIYYRRYIGAYQKRTTRLSMRDHGAYGLMLDFYYAEEQPLPLEIDDILDICKARTADDKKSIEKVLRLHFVKRQDGYHNERADEEIAASQQARTNGKKGGRKKTDSGTDDDTGEGTEPVTGPRTGPKAGGGTGMGTEPITEEGGGTVHPSTFNHSAVQPSAFQPPTDSPANPGAQTGAPPPPSRAAAIAVKLRLWEKDRDKVTKIHSAEPRVQEWAKAGVTDEQLREAYDLAVADRAQGQDDGPINAGFLHVFVQKLINPKAATGAPLVQREWHETLPGVLAKCREIGYEPKPEDDPRWLKCVIAVRTGGDHWPWIDPKNATLARWIEELREEQGQVG